MKRLLAVLVAAVLGTSLAGIDGASATSGVSTTAARPSAIPWGSCGAGSTDKCYDFEVPLDHANPAGDKITLALRMRPHTSATSKGVLLVNPGGPGGSGTGMVGLADWVPGNVGHAYDVIGWDPRGVGDSRPALRCNPTYFGVNRPNFVPRTKRLMRYWKTRSARYAAACGSSAAKRLLPHMTTWDNVQDMDLIRQALGESKINFYGFSYGSYLGQIYATRFPDHVGRFVFDGVVDPATYWYKANLRQEIGFDRNLNIFFKWVARHSRVYHLGRDWRAIRRGFNAELRRLDRHPAYHRKLGPDELTDAMLGAGYYVYNWDSLAAAYSSLVRKHRGGPLFRVYRDGNMGDDNGYAVYLGVQCTDVLRPAWSTQVRDAWRIHRKRPFLAWDNTWFNAPCRSWPAPSLARIGVSGVKAAAKGGRFLLVNETLDAATPYSGALRVRSVFPSSRLIAGVGGTTHAGSLSGVACVDNRVASFLDTGALPARLSGSRADVRCHKVPPPPASSGRYAGTAARGMPPALRELLADAQLIGRG